MSSLVNVVPVPVSRLDDVWEYAAPELQRAFDTAGSHTTPEELRRLLEDDSHVLWRIVVDGEDTAYAVTRIVGYETRQVLEIAWVGGRDMAAWIDNFLSVMRLIAEHNDCEAMAAHGRIGWSRWLRRRGFEQKYITYEARLDG